MWYLITLIHTNTYLKVDNMPTIGFESKRKCKLCGKVFAGGVDDGGAIEGHPALKQAFDMGASIK